MSINNQWFSVNFANVEMIDLQSHTNCLFD